MLKVFYKSLSIYSKILRSKHFIPLLLVVFCGVLASRTLLFQSGYFNMHDDLQMMRQLELEKCFQDGQIPCRWIPDMGYGFGFPLFNFYPPFPYLFAQIFRLIGFSFVVTAKLNFASAIIFSGITMYFFARQFFGRVGGVVSAVFYIWAPYHAVDIYVRGAMNESWALVWYPLIMWSTYKIITSDKKHFRWILTLSLSYAALFLSHNLMVLIFTPFYAVWIMIWLLVTKKWWKIFSVFISGLWSLGMAAFFTLPAVVENKYTHIRSQLIGYYDYSAHFVSIGQLLFSTYWGYGPSLWGVEADRMSFQIGQLHWIFSLFVLFSIFLLLFFKRKSLVNVLFTDHFIIACLFMFAVGWMSAFMTHTKSIALWQSFPQLSYTQFPWRFLTLVIFSFSFMVGFIPGVFIYLRRNLGVAGRFITFPYQISLASILIVSIVTINWNYFLPEYGKMGPLKDEEKFSGKAWEYQQTSGIYDYLPITAQVAPTGPQTSVAEILDGDGVLKDMFQGTNWAHFNAEIESETAQVRINIFDFPGWGVYSENEKLPVYIPDTEIWGRMYIDLPRGKHTVYAQFTNTPIRTLANLVSVVSWGILLLIVLLRKRLWFFSK